MYFWEATKTHLVQDVKFTAGFLRLFQLLSRATDTEQISPKGWLGYHPEVSGQIAKIPKPEWRGFWELIPLFFTTISGNSQPVVWSRSFAYRSMHSLQIVPRSSSRLLYITPGCKWLLTFGDLHPCIQQVFGGISTPQNPHGLKGLS